jgi:hypothetical protein
MVSRKLPAEAEVAEWLDKGRLDAPPLRFRLCKRQPVYQRGGRPWDFEVSAAWGKQTARFAAEYKSLSTPKVFEETLATCAAAPLPNDRLPLLMMPYLRPEQLERLEQAGVSGVDCCGNCVIVVPDRFRVFRTGAENRFSSTAPIKNIYRRNTSMVARLLAAVPAFANFNAVCEAVNARNPLVQCGRRTPMRPGTVSKALKGLEDDLIVERSGAIRVLQPEKLLSQLADNYSPPQPVRQVRLKVKKPGRDLCRLLGKAAGDECVPIVATGLSSVGRYAVMAREELLAVYCPRVEEVVEWLGATETDRFADLELIEAAEEPLYFDARQEDGFAWASPLQTYLELMSGDKRDKETAEQVKSRLLRTLKGE